MFDSHIADVWRAANDGSGSGLDADLLDGLHAAQLVRADISTRLVADSYLQFPNSTYGAALRLGGNGYTAAGADASVVTTNGNLHLDAARASQLFLNYYSGTGGIVFGNGAGGAAASMSKDGSFAAPSFDGTIMRRGGTNLFGADNDGAGSGLDADLLDGQQGSWYADVASRLGYRPVQQGGGIGQLANLVKIGWAANDRLKVTVDATDQGGVVFDSHIADVWRVANDGAGSGLDADLLDGQHGAWYADVAGRLGYVPASRGGDTFTGQVTVRTPGPALKLAVAESGYGFMQFGEAANANVAFNWHLGSNGDGSFSLFQGPWGSGTQRLFVNSASITFNGNAMWHSANDGAGSGLDADLLDGYQASDFMLANALGASTFSENGYQILPGGLILQWCTGFQQSNGSEPTQSITFPLTFPNRCLNALVSTNISSAAVSVDTFYQIAGLPSPSGVTVQRQVTAQGADSRPTTPLIFAIGF